MYLLLEFKEKQEMLILLKNRPQITLIVNSTKLRRWDFSRNNFGKINIIGRKNVDNVK
jgi:hypothetical protein